MGYTGRNISEGTLEAIDGRSLKDHILELPERLTAQRTYYVRKDGNDSNNGLADTAGGAFLSIQKGINSWASLDVQGLDTILQVGLGTYVENLIALDRPKNCGDGSLIIRGDIVTPSNVIVSPNALFHTLLVEHGVFIQVEGIRLTTTRSFGKCVLSQFGAQVTLLVNCELSAPSGYHLGASSGGAIFADGYTTIGNARMHAIVGGGSAFIGGTAVIQGTPAFSEAFITCYNGGIVEASGWTGAATGKRYDVFLNGIINTGGGGANFLPGSIAGTVATGGQYV